MTMNVRAFFPVFALTLLIPGAAAAHGVGYRLSDKNAVVMEFYYSTGEMMAYQETRVFSPRDAKNPYQSGRTDEFGRYAFVPDSSGEWKAIAQDIEGHRLEAVVRITEDFFVTDSANAEKTSAVTSERRPLPRGTELFWRAVIGVSVIFNIAAFVLLARAGKIPKEARG